MSSYSVERVAHVFNERLVFVVFGQKLQAEEAHADVTETRQAVTVQAAKLQNSKHFIQIDNVEVCVCGQDNLKVASTCMRRKSLQFQYKATRGDFR